MIKYRGIAKAIVTIPSAAYTAGTAFNVAHGLTYTPSLDAIIVQARSGDNAIDDVQQFGLVSADATNVRLKPSRTATSTGRLIIFAEKNLAVVAGDA